MTKMENCSLRLSGRGQLYPESIIDAKPRFWQLCSSPVSRTEIICPKPHRATRVPFVLDGLGRFGSMSKGILPVHRGRHNMETLDFILCKDELEIVPSDAAGIQTSFLCGSPPVRTSNPVVQDAEFAKLALLPSSPLGSNGMKPTRSDKGSPSCGSPLRAKPKVRVEGFICSSPESSHIVPAMA